MLSFLESHRVDDLPARDPVICSTSDDFATAFQRLIDGDVQSAPLFDAQAKQYVGFLDTRDLVSLALVVFDKSQAAGGENKEAAAGVLARMWSHLSSVEDGVTLAYMARRNPFLSVPLGTPLTTLVRMLLNLRSTRVRRVAVVDAQGVVRNVVSQMTVVQFVAQQLDIVDEARDAIRFDELKRSVQEAAVGSYPAVTVDESAAMSTVFKTLDERNIGGVAVTNANGAVIGNVSARDIKAFVHNPTLSQLTMTAHDFLAKQREAQIDIRTPIIHCLPSTTLRRVLFLFAGTLVHRLYVVDSDEAMKPVGVLSLSDTVKSLFGDACQHAQTHAIKG